MGLKTIQIIEDKDNKEEDSHAKAYCCNHAQSLHKE